MRTEIKWIMAGAFVLLLIPGVHGIYSDGRVMEGFSTAPDGPVPVPDFVGSPLSGDMPLTVSFTDQSSGSPTGRAWFFGDEDYTEPWELVTPHAPWSGRGEQNVVVMPDGHLVLISGSDSWYHTETDVWISVDKGATWSEQTPYAPWSGRWGHCSVVMPDGSIVMMGGTDGYTGWNDVWRSTDEGMTWTLVTPHAGWSGRAGHAAAALPDGRIVVMGGWSTHQMNDVWRSDDGGATWTEETAHAPWGERNHFGSLGMPDGSIVIMGGWDYDHHIFYNDVWKSKDAGATWIRLNASAGWTGRYGLSSVLMPDASILVMAGNDRGTGSRHDVWRSADTGLTWERLTDHAAWPERCTASCVALPDGSILLMGGNWMNDIWRFVPASSNEQDPVHTYTTPGTYQVSLQVYNNNGFADIQKPGYVRVTAGRLGNISVSSTPPGAAIYLDGNNMHLVTPSTIHDVLAGEHTVNIELPGYVDGPQTVIVPAGGTVEVSFTLVQVPEFPTPQIPFAGLIGFVAVVLLLAQKKHT